IWDVEGQVTVDTNALERIASVINVHASGSASRPASGSGPREDVQYAMAVRITQNQCIQGSNLQDLASLKKEVSDFKNTLTGRNVFEGQMIIAARDKNEKHSEYRLLLEGDGKVIKKLLQNTAERNDEDCVIFYTYNSPCLDTCLNETADNVKRERDEKRIEQGKKPKETYRCIYPALDIFTEVRGPKALVFTLLYGEDPNNPKLSECLGKITEKIPLYQCDNNRCRRCEQGNSYCTAR
ncbi:hypothetical protein NFI96_028892, partial [Prochilodus magdalenae]